MTSKIKVDNINKVSDDSNIINKCGTTITVGAASDGVRTGADNLQASDGGNLISQSGTTITLGASGDTITLASGASQTGFGRTGTVDWQTSSIKTATFTAANGEGYFCNTTSGGFTVNLPAGSAGAIVSVQDYNNTFDTGNLTITPNGSEKINGGEGDIILNSEGEGLTLVYVDGTVGWRSIQDSAFADIGSNFIVATGGTITNVGNCRIHTFTGPGTFTVCSVSTCAANNTVSHLVVAGGGGGGGSNVGGGGGAGGYREVKSPVTPYTASPLDGYPSSPNRVTVTAQAYPITVGGGGPAPNGNGNPSVFSTVTSTAGGAGKGGSTNGATGGSGGGGGENGGSGGAGNTPPVSPAQGFPGGAAPSTRGGGGGGASEAGASGTTSTGRGGNGVGTEINPAAGTPGPSGPLKYFSGGGGGGTYKCGSYPGGGPGGYGGGGTGAQGGPGSTAGVAGTANTGGGGGGTGYTAGPTHGGAANGGSGVVIIRYKVQ